MINFDSLLTIIAMATVTYLTRVSGYYLLKNRQLSPKTKKILEAVPGCVLISVIAPAFATTNPANLLSLGITILLACRFSLLTTVVLSVVVTASLRYAFQFF